MTDLYDLQDVARCYLCETPTPVLYCRFCEKNLCTNCQKTHVLDDSKSIKSCHLKGGNLLPTVKGTPQI